MGPDSFMNRTLIALQIQSSFQKCLPFLSFSRQCILTKVKRFPVFLAITSQHHLCRAHQRSLHAVKERSHITNTLENHQKAFLKEITGGPLEITGGGMTIPQKNPQENLV